MIKIRTIIISSVLFLVVFFLDKWGVFKNPIIAAVILVLMLLAYPIGWRLKEYIKEKYPQDISPPKCPSCGFDISDNPTHCRNCGEKLREITVDDKFEQDGKEKKICPYCGLKELETIYEISRGYKEVCASCGKSRVSRRAIKITLIVLAWFVGGLFYFYWLFQISQK